MEIPEIIIIAIILILWFLSIRKFTKQFERIRTTHYREIPYSYKSQKLVHDNKITIVKRETDSVIYAPSIKRMSRSKSYPSVHSNENVITNVKSENNINTINNERKASNKDEIMNEIRKRSRSERNVNNRYYNMTLNSQTYNDNYTSITSNSALHNHRGSTAEVKSIHYIKCIPADDSRLPFLVELDGSPRRINQYLYKAADKSSYDSIKAEIRRNSQLLTIQNERGYQKGEKKQKNVLSKQAEYNTSISSEEDHQYIDPFLIPPIVKRSLLDLHRRSAEHISSTLAQKNLNKKNNVFKSVDRVNIEKTRFLESPV